MKNDTYILEKLHSISDREWIEIVDKLTKWVYFKLKGKTLFGAHSEQELGVRPVDYYVDDAIGKLFSLEWKWQFEEYSIHEQLQRIVGSLISANVEKYKTNKVTVIPTEDDILNILAEKYNSDDNDNVIYNSFLEALSICTNGDYELELYSLAVLELDSFDEISKELKWDKAKLYVLQKKLARRVMKYLETQQQLI